MPTSLLDVRQAVTSAGRLARTSWRAPGTRWFFAAAMACAGAVGCTADVGQVAGDAGTGATGVGTGTGGSGTTGTGGSSSSGTGGRGSSGTGGSGVSTGTGGSGTVTGTGGTGTGTGGVTMGTGGATLTCDASTINPGRAPLRRLTQFEYGNTVRDIFADTTAPEGALPAEVLASGIAIFGNNADSQSVSSLLAEKYGTVAEGIAQRATMTATALGKLASCGSTITSTTVTATEDTCARSIISALVPKVYRRTITTTETDELVTLYKAVRSAATGTFASGIAAVIEATLQGPDFLYRVEFGAPDSTKPTLKRPTGYEMATRLSYLFWGTSPDATLTTAASSGSLVTSAGVMTQAQRLLDDQRSHAVVAFYFDSLLPINGLTTLERDKTTYPNFNATIGSLMHQETQRFLEYEIYEGPGTYTDILTAPYTFVNAALATYYGMTGVTGTTFQKVSLDTKKRIGLLSQGGVMAGSTVSNTTSPVLRGSFVVQKLMCKPIPLPTGDILAMVKPPDPYSFPTARERFAAHSANAVCHACHQFMDPVGLALENFDPVGQWRDTENNVTIDASGGLQTPGDATSLPVSGPVDLMKAIAASDYTTSCFATHWMEFAYGRAMTTADGCTQQSAQTAFKSSGYNVKKLLLALTQTDAFLYLPAQ